MTSREGEAKEKRVAVVWEGSRVHKILCEIPPMRWHQLIRPGSCGVMPVARGHRRMLSAACNDDTKVRATLEQTCASLLVKVLLRPRAIGDR